MLAATMLWQPAPWLVWNASPSSPIGLYAVGRPSAVRSGDVVIAWPPPKARRLASERRYLPAGVPLVKKVAAASGASVCARGPAIRIDGRQVAVRRRRDPRGRLLPSWSGCTRLGPGELFLLSADSPAAFDGRYFGITRPSEIIGSGILLWAR